MMDGGFEDLQVLLFLFKRRSHGAHLNMSSILCQKRRGELKASERGAIKVPPSEE